MQLNGITIDGASLDLSTGSAFDRRVGFFSDIYYDRSSNAWWGLSDRGPGGGTLPYDTRLQRFTLDGVDYQLELNERGVSHLHGGSDGMGRQNWTILEHGSDFVVMEVTDPEGRAGYPGTTRTRATFAL